MAFVRSSLGTLNFCEDFIGIVSVESFVFFLVAHIFYGIGEHKSKDSLLVNSEFWIYV